MMKTVYTKKHGSRGWLTATACTICLLLAAGSMVVLTPRRGGLPGAARRTSLSWHNTKLKASAILGTSSAHQQLGYHPTGSADHFVVELGVTYGYNDLVHGLSTTATAESCAALCRAFKPTPCVAWSWLPASHGEQPSTCSLKSARGSVVKPSPGAVSGYLSGTTPYTLERGKLYSGYALANATGHSLEDCATACTAFDGARAHSRCSAWTWWPGDANQPGSCTLKSTKGNATQEVDDGVVSGYLAGTSPYVVYQGMTIAEDDKLTDSSSQQPSPAACAAACRRRSTAPPCVAWTYSNSTDKQAGTCRLAAATGPMRPSQQDVVSGHMPELVAAGETTPAALRPYIVERGVGYGFNDIPMGMTNQDSAEACAAACTAKGTGPACIAWTWAAATHPSWPGQCRLMSARGSDIQQEPGLVSGYLSGTAPYQVEADREYVGHELVILSQPDSAAHSPRQCASACTRYQGRVRCSAWTFVHMPSSSAGNCTLRSSKGYDAVRSPGAVSGYVAGTHPYILQQGMADVFSDLPDGVQQQPGVGDCAAACREYKGPAPCIAWSYSSPTHSTPGTCWLKGTLGSAPKVAKTMVSAVMPGADPYQLKRNARYDGDVIDVLLQPNAAACATTCSLWQTRGVSCSAWFWSPKDQQAGGDCTLLSRISPLTQKAQGSVAGSLGTAQYTLQPGTQLRGSDLPDATTTQPSAGACAKRCARHNQCVAWTWHHPTMAEEPSSCHLKGDNPDPAVNATRNVQATSGLMSDNRHILWSRVVTSMIEPSAQQRVWATSHDRPRLALAIVEMRQHPWLQGVLYNAAHLYGGRRDVSLHIYHGTDNADFVKGLVSGWRNVHLHNLEVKGLTVPQYSTLLVTKSFYDKLGDAGHVLVFQVDTLLLRPIDEVFYKYDYVGAPWPFHVHDPNLGNGGLSLRRVSTMREICPPPGTPEKDTHPEDVYLVRRIKKENMPSVELAKGFSVEFVYHPSPCGLHKAYNYHSQAKVREWLRGVAPFVRDPAVLRKMSLPQPSVMIISHTCAACCIMCQEEGWNIPYTYQRV